jgi:cytochrome c-type biogenesis protein CcmH/NrfG
MLLWIAFALMTATVLAAVLLPLARPAREQSPEASGALAVYRHQLDEIEAERTRGLVDDKEAAAAKTEVSRRCWRPPTSSTVLRALLALSLVAARRRGDRHRCLRPS